MAKRKNDLEDILSDIKKTTQVGVLIKEDINEADKQEATRLKAETMALFQEKTKDTTVSPASNQLGEEKVALTKETGGTESVPGTNTAPNITVPSTDNVPSTNNVPSTKSVPGTVSVGTVSVPGTVCVGTKSVPGTVSVGTVSVPGTDSVLSTKSVPGTKNAPIPCDTLINKMSAAERYSVLNRITSLQIPAMSRCILVLLLNTMCSEMEILSITSLSKQLSLRKQTLIDSLSSLRNAALIGYQGIKAGTEISLTPFLHGTNTVPPIVSMYVSSKDYISSTTNKQTIHGTKSVPGSKTPQKTIEIRIRKERATKIIYTFAVKGFLNTGKHKNGMGQVNKLLIQHIWEATEKEKTFMVFVGLVLYAKDKAKESPFGYLKNILLTMNRDSIENQYLEEGKVICSDYDLLNENQLDEPSLKELKETLGRMGVSVPDTRERKEVKDLISLKWTQIKEVIEAILAKDFENYFSEFLAN